MKQLLLWTNMYPTSCAPFYGTFVRSTERAWKQMIGENNVSLVAIRNKPTSKLSKITLYTDLMIRCILSIFSQPKNAMLEIHYPVYFLPVLFLNKLLCRKRYIVLRFHGSDLKKITGSRFFTVLFNAIKGSVDLYVVPSDYYREKVSSELKIPIEKVIKVFPDCVGDEFFVRGNVDKNELQKDSDTFHIGFVSRLETVKNCHELIEAFAKLSISSAKLTIVGDGSQRASLESLSKQLGIAEKVEFKGALAREELPVIMAMFDVFVFPSVSETESFGLVALEALACGTPVIANNQLKAANEYLDNDRNGYFYNDGAEGLSRALKRYYAMSPDAKADMSEEAKKVRQKFSFHNVFSVGVESILSRQQTDHQKTNGKG
ncbi:glycosyltransferase family 4 protein [Halomonas alkaliantarctica]|uniref:glycosyltransferase family 4 protein n=1 Tax=Halomonas alkaliantarctica TaxID=232346 RepID=UPI0004AA0D8C|nr:glycosyltransferase family 4 protein [Halomonas alkaliantarctica]